MTNLPQTMIEAEALAHARGAFAELHDADLLGLGIPTIHPEAGPIFVRSTLKMIALSHPLNMMSVIDHARAGWYEADTVLRELTIEIVDRGDSLPTALGAYTMEVIRGHPPQPRGPKKATNALQDILVAGVVCELIERFGLKPTRNALSRRVSACDIVAAAVNEAGIGRSVGYKAVERLWLRYGVWLQSDSRSASGQPS
jgi:hypothetical protein